ncbi:2-succinylbenzoate-ligase [Grosmannia clavigera kw1407]|uniref:2-succinylbenzoate-ligase n=1 Tax=Grosmannia clavigera (strain kw1407 / UAMH 11150) TaxID=655863 RepID=F0XS99_GROCL|nr:2-succinylbenzoate-ligase [Grosmannia clavigera kw1407]EFW99631.1 2-succinylbenzoate-ligase [Grosmannia clavigera kw1407]
MASALPRLPVFEAIARQEPNSTAVVHSLSGRRFQYGELLGDIRKTRNRLVEASGKSDLNGERIAFMVENSYDYIVTLLAILAARSIAVPLSPAFPVPELQYIVDHSEAALVLSSAKFQHKIKDLLAVDLVSKPTYVDLAKHLGGAPHEAVELDAELDAGGAGIMLYTSGTTNRPKGVLIPERVMTAQASSLTKAWEYSSSDHFLHVLPLHHIHGTINALYTPLFTGGSIEFLFPFNADAVWNRFAAPFLPRQDGATDSASEPITFFTVVPTVYSRLLATHKALSPQMQAATCKAISPEHLRLSISGSAALPSPVKKAWEDLSHGSVLLERFGMTEVGMALSCGLENADRVDGSVGWPLPSVEARLVDVDTGKVIEPGQEVDPETGRERAGEIQLRGPTIFAEYWRNPSATSSEFAAAAEPGGKAWFKTGDVAVRRPVAGAGAARETRPSQDWTGRGDMYFILGRRSADIIKSGGEKVSALEVERELLSIPAVAEAAVVAVPSGKWGQKVGAVLVMSDGEKPWTAMDMRRALKGRLVNYKIPQLLRLVEQIPRNAMGKINKKQLVAQVFQDDFSGDEAGPTVVPSPKGQ